MNKYLIAIPSFKGLKGFCHKTILISAKTETEAVSKFKRMRPNENLGDIKKVDY